MRIPAFLQLFAAGLLALILISITSVFAAGITVPVSNIGQDTSHVTAENLKPPSCDGLYLTNIVSGFGTLIGTSANDLIIGSSGADTIDGLGGNDCILGGGGDDFLTGNDGDDVCLGGTGNNNFTNCEVEAQ